MVNKSLQYNLGFLIGEYIISQYLPVLNICHFGTNHVIDVTEEEQIEHNRLSDVWYTQYEIEKHNKSKGKLAQKEWIDLRTYDVFLTNKYLPKTLKCFIPIVIDLDQDLSEIKDGIRTSLWNSDVCEYNLAIDKIQVIKPKETILQEDVIIVNLELDSKFDENEN